MPSKDCGDPHTVSALGLSELEDGKIKVTGAPGKSAKKSVIARKVQVGC